MTKSRKGYYRDYYRRRQAADPTFMERHRERVRLWQRMRRAAETPEEKAERNYALKLRKAAQEEARERGVDFRVILQAWGARVPRRYETHTGGAQNP